jgi:medium-chain acyl-[acyl-carrier-protein] hydrolase
MSRFSPSATLVSPQGGREVIGSWLIRRWRDSKANLRLFCFPFAGGGASSFGSWPYFLPAEIEVCAVQLPGRESRMNEAPFAHLSLLVEKLRVVLLPYLDAPFAFYGHSMGALIGFELARHLRKQREACPFHLFVACHRAPHLPDPHRPVHRLPDLDLVTELTRRYGTSEILLQNAELREMFLPALRADLGICETYLYSRENPLDIPITAFGGAQDQMVSREELAAWRVHTCSRFTVRALAGGHFFTQSTQRLIASILSQELGRSTKGLKNGHTSWKTGRKNFDSI